MQRLETTAIGVYGEHSSVPGTPILRTCPVHSVANDKQTCGGIGPISATETMQDGEALRPQPSGKQPTDKENELQ